MDKYLNRDEVYLRLKREVIQYGKLIFGVDFDDTLYDYHKTGASYSDVIDLLHRWEKYSEVIITTGNGGNMQPFIEEYLTKKMIRYKGINCDSSVSFGGRKVYANAYLDDRGGLAEIYEVLTTLITEIENGVVVPGYQAFDATKAVDYLIEWIRSTMNEIGISSNIIIGLSGGKDSTILADLCAKAIGKNRVVGIILPNGEQKDIDDAISAADYAGIPFIVHNIEGAFDAIRSEIVDNIKKYEEKYTKMTGGMYTIAPSPFLIDKSGISKQTVTNLPARLRMAVLYAYAQSFNGRVVNTCNLSEDYVGYATRYGDGAGDFSPLSHLTVTEIKMIGHCLGIPDYLVDKVPSDGLCGATDEDNLGFTYAVLDKYIRTGKIDDLDVKRKIDTMHQKNLFKLQMMPSCVLPQDIFVA